MKRLITVFSALILISCSVAKSKSSSMPSKQYNHNAHSDKGYGYSESNAVKVGGVKTMSGPVNERDYLSSLSGPNGERVWFNRDGSCCPFESSNSSFGGMLDIYSVTYEGKGDTVKIYINMYDEDVLYAPEGFKFRM